MTRDEALNLVFWMRARSDGARGDALSHGEVQIMCSCFHSWAGNTTKLPPTPKFEVGAIARSSYLMNTRRYLP
jgi:hypothetical protein